MDWNLVYKTKNIPKEKGQLFYARRTECSCGINMAQIKNCLPNSPCVVKFLVLNDKYFIPFFQYDRESKKPIGRRYFTGKFSYWIFSLD